jgi:hypothetical protein
VPKKVQATVTIDVTRRTKDSPPVFTNPTAYSIKENENQPVGKEVLRVTATDADKQVSTEIHCGLLVNPLLLLKLQVPTLHQSFYIGYGFIRDCLPLSSILMYEK